MVMAKQLEDTQAYVFLPSLPHPPSSPSPPLPPPSHANEKNITLPDENITLPDVAPYKNTFPHTKFCKKIFAGALTLSPSPDGIRNIIFCLTLCKTWIFRRFRRMTFCKPRTHQLPLTQSPSKFDERLPRD